MLPAALCGRRASARPEGLFRPDIGISCAVAIDQFCARLACLIAKKQGATYERCAHAPADPAPSITGEPDEGDQEHQSRHGLQNLAGVRVHLNNALIDDSLGDVNTTFTDLACDPSAHRESRLQNYD